MVVVTNDVEEEVCLYSNCSSLIHKNVWLRHMGISSTVENNFSVPSLLSQTCFVLLSYVTHQPSCSEDLTITELLKIPQTVK